MNKLLVLLYFALIVSFSCSKDCQESECSYDGIDNDKRANYICISEDGETCVAKLLCEYAVKTGEDTTFKCSNYHVSNADKTCIDNTEKTGCREEFKCAKVPKETEGATCSSYPVTDETKYSCETDGTEYACKEVPYVCNTVPKSVGTIQCSDYALSAENQYTHYCTNSNEGETEKACQEKKYECSAVPKINEETTIKCSDFDVDSEKTGKYACVENTASTEKQCMELKHCSEVIESDVTKTTDCSSFYYDKKTSVCHLNEAKTKCVETYLCSGAPSGAEGECSTFVTSDENLLCVNGDSGSDKKCKEEPYCSKVPKPANNEPSIDCSKYQVKQENHICIQDLESQTYACKEEIACDKATRGATNQECAKYPVVNEHKNSHGCVKDSTDGKFCKEEELCTLKTLTDATDEECAKYPVAFSKIKTHICIKNTAGSGSSCIEQPLCEAVERADGIVCSNYKVKEENKQTHICVASKIGDNPCQEMMLCEKNEIATSDEECRNYPVKVENQSTKRCVKTREKDKNGCIEEQLCAEVPKGDNVDCSLYPVSDNNVATHFCDAISNPTDKACHEVEKSSVECTKAKKGGSDAQCNGYKVSAETKKCVKNTDTTSGATPCIEKEKCESKTSGATDEICANLAVEKPGEEICVKNGEKCSLLTYCNYASGSSDEICAKFALKDKEKECKKKEGENKCEEVEKKIEKTEKVTPGEDDGEKTDKDKASDEDEKSDENKDTSKTTEAATPNKGSDNSGNLVNVAYSLLLIIYLVLF